MNDVLDAPLVLPCGFVLKNRIAKAAMSECLATVAGSEPSARLIRLYERFAAGGAGLVITGNVMVSADGIGEHGNVVFRPETPVTLYEDWARAAGRNGTACFMQLNHAGRQSPKLLNPRPVAPSAVPMSLGHLKVPGLFADPRALGDEEVSKVIADFVSAAGRARQAGFAGVQIHAAHGYLISQFLSPLTNLRTDCWGGQTVDQRMRFLIEVYRGIRGACGDRFPIAVKLNSADFLRGGFSHEESVVVARTLGEEGVDLIEISGGTYEQAVMAAHPKEHSTLREAHFLDYARIIRQATRCPLMLTGGLRTPSVMADVLRDGAADLVGLARAVALEPDLPRQILAGRTAPARTPVRRLYGGFLNLMLDSGWYQDQMRRLSEGGSIRPESGVLWIFVRAFAASLEKGRRRLQG